VQSEADLSGAVRFALLCATARAVGSESAAADAAGATELFEVRCELVQSCTLVVQKAHPDLGLNELLRLPLSPLRDSVKRFSLRV